ncbi:hypothetical protein LP422_22295 [Janibacter limosus]|nr:hypothetical protein [Janibacter limosus]WKV16773.1 hypothetical protein LP422_22295 [Janibacter limosus]
MASTLTALTFGTPDPRSLALFWGGLLGRGRHDRARRTSAGATP